MVRTRDCADMVRQKRLGEALTSAMALVMSVSHAMSKEERGGVPSLMSLPLPFSRADEVPAAVQLVLGDVVLRRDDAAVLHLHRALRQQLLQHHLALLVHLSCVINCVINCVTCVIIIIITLILFADGGVGHNRQRLLVQVIEEEETAPQHARGTAEERRVVRHQQRESRNHALAGGRDALTERECVGDAHGGNGALQHGHQMHHHALLVALYC